MEERLCKKPKKEFATWTEKLNLDYLAKLGPQWWVMRVGRLRGQEIVERLARSLARNYPDLDFKVSDTTAFSCLISGFCALCLFGIN